MILLLILFSRIAAFSQESTTGKNLPSVEIPAGGIITLKAAALNATSYQWFKDGIIIQNARGIIYQAFEPGIYTVLAYNDANCSSILSEGINLTLKALQANQADLQIVKKSESTITGINEPFEYLISVTNKGPKEASNVVVTDVFPQELTLNNIIMPGTGIYNFNPISKTLTWKIDKLISGENADLRLNVSSINPGIVKNKAEVAASEEDPYLANNQSTDEKEITGVKVPNVFTPNADNVNDVFEIRGLELYAENNISIINRWGNSIYEKNNYKNDWDGNGLDEGTYFYILKVKAATGKWFTYKGYTTILRAEIQ